MGSDGLIAHSVNWGHTWATQESGVPAGVELWEVYFIDDQEGWIVGGGQGQPGVILHTTTGGHDPAVSVESIAPNTPFSLEQNHPNPFVSSTRITFHLPNEEAVSIHLFNSQGQLVNVLYEQFTPAGSHHIDVNAEFLLDGVYFYSIKAGRFKDHKKMLRLDSNIP